MKTTIHVHHLGPGLGQTYTAQCGAPLRRLRSFETFGGVVPQWLVDVVQGVYVTNWDEKPDTDKCPKCDALITLRALKQDDAARFIWEEGDR